MAGSSSISRFIHSSHSDHLFAAATFVLVNDHDPKPLYYQFAAEYPGSFTWAYGEKGSEVWRVRIGKTEGAKTAQI